MNPENDWKARVLMVTMTKDMQYTVYSALWREMIGRSKIGIFPRVIGPGWITESGAVYCRLIDKFGVYHSSNRLTSRVDDFRDGWRLLADVAELTDAERIEMFDLIRGWIGRDYRVHSPLSASDKDPT